MLPESRALGASYPAAIAPLVLAFLVGAATLALELVAARVASLNVGVSLYSWSGVIGAVLGGLATGSAASGRLVDRTASPRRLIGRLLGGVAVYAPLAVTALSAWPVVSALGELPRLERLGVVLLLVAFLPALALGAVGPALARLAIDRPDAAGRQAGRLFAATALGSLVGAGLTGLVLVPALGVRGTSLLTGAALVLPLLRRGALRPAAPLLLVAAAAWGAPHACDDESMYQCIRVAEESAPDGGARTVRVLYLDGLPHAHVDLEDPLDLAHDYLVPAAELAHYPRRGGGAAPRVLVIGGGGYSLPRYLAAAFGDPPIDVLELDPAVTETARRRLGLPLRPPFAIHHGDARQTLAELPAGARYDLAVLDAFSDVVVPFHLVTDGFDRAVRDRLAPGGLYAALVHDRGDTGRLLPAAARTMRSVFGAVDVLAAGPGVRWRSSRPRTWTLVGSGEGIDAERLKAVRRQTAAGPFPPLSEPMPPEELRDLLARPGPVLLSDDYAPVEILAAPLFQ